MKLKIILIPLIACSISSGCGIGQKKVLFTTRSNVGLDVDAKQFTAQLNIDRQEAVIGPTFEGGKHVPVAASFVNNNRLLGGFGVSSMFAGGDAALAITNATNNAITSGQSLINLSQEPRYERGLVGKVFDKINPFITGKEIENNKKLPGPGEVKPFIFDTDTSLGIKLAWTGATGEFPDKVKIGFNREEFVLAPVTATKKSDCPSIDAQETNKIACAVGIPSFFALLDVNSDFKSIFSSEIGFKQIFAAGDSATNFANNHDVKAMVNEKFGFNKSSDCLSKWLVADASDADKRSSAEKIKAVNDFLQSSSPAMTLPQLLNDANLWHKFSLANISPGICG